MAEKYDRCRCTGLKFTEINDHAQEMHTTSIKRLKRELDMGVYCSACVPFLKEMFKTGQTVFTEQDNVTP